MGNLLHAEWYKLVHDRTYWITLAVTLLLNTAIFTGNDAIPAMPGQTAFKLGVSREILSALIVCVYGGAFLGQDFANRTFYHSLAAGKSRGTALMAKALVFALASDLILFLFPLVFTVLCTIRNGWGAPLSAGEGMHLAAVVVTLLILGFGISAVSLFAAVCFRNVGGTLGLPLILNFAALALIVTPLASSAVRLFPVSVIILAADGAVKPAYGMGLGLLWFGILSAASVLVFRRAELH